MTEAATCRMAAAGVSAAGGVAAGGISAAGAPTAAEPAGAGTAAGVSAATESTTAAAESAATVAAATVPARGPAEQAHRAELVGVRHGREAAQQGHELLVGRGVAAWLPAAAAARRAPRRRHRIADAVRRRLVGNAVASARRCAASRSRSLAPEPVVELAVPAAGGTAAVARQAGVPRVGGAEHLVARALDRAHRQVHRMDAALLQHLDDLRVALRHRLGHVLPELAGVDAAMVAVARDRFDALVQRRADDLGAQRVALVVGAAEREERSHVGRQVAQLPVALVRDQLAEADVVHPRLDLLDIDQAERLPVGRLELALLVDLGREVLGDPLAQRLVERALEHAHVATQLLHRVEDELALGRPGGALCLHVETFCHAHRRRRGRRPDEVHGRVERGLYAWFDRIHLGRDAPRRAAARAGGPLCRRSSS